MLLTIAWARTVHAVNRLRPDVVILSMILHRHILWIATKLARRDRVLAQLCHEIVEAEERGVPAERRVDRLMLSIDRIFFLSRSVEQDFLRRIDYPPGQTAIIPHPRPEVFGSSTIPAAEMLKRLGLDADQTVLLFFGVLRPAKGVEDLVDAFAASRSRQAAQLLIAGRATKLMDMEGLLERIARHGLDDRVKIMNRYIGQDEVRPIFELARAIVLPYRTAAASGVLHQAYAFECAPIVTAVGGLAEDVIDGETGLIAPPGDIPALADCMDRLVEDADLAARLGKAGNEYSNANFGWPSIAARIATILTEDSARKRSHRAG